MKRLLSVLVATTTIAGCSDMGAMQNVQEAVRHEGYFYALGRLLCGIPDSRSANLKEAIDLQVRANHGLAEYSVKGSKEAESAFKVAQEQGKLLQLKATECPKITLVVTSWPPPPDSLRKLADRAEHSKP